MTALGPSNESRSPEARQRQGRTARTLAPRTSHAELRTDGRADPIRLLQDQARTRVPELVGLRYARMAASPFAFFRGAAKIMAADLASSANSNISVQLCGDAHLANFGLFASPERQLVFDINDFDETLPGPWEWDVKRLATSLEVAARDNGVADTTRRSIVAGSVAEYRRAMNEFATWSNLRVWYAYLPVEPEFARLRSSLDRATASFASKTIAKAKTRDQLQAFQKLVRVEGDQLRFASDPPLLVPVEELVKTGELERVPERVRGAIASYRESLSDDRRRLLDQFEVVHVARKVVGVGSVGTRAWVVLMRGRDSSDAMILQIKEAAASVLEEFSQPSRYDNSGHRVVAGQRMIQASSDILLGWQRFAGFDETPRDFYVRQLRDWKGSAEIDQMTPQVIASYGRLCAWTLARAHARTGDRIAIGAYLGRKPVFDEAITSFAATYADLNESDHAALVSAIGSGTVSTT
jgi:uncharacterized protein (DUF2252 family)